MSLDSTSEFEFFSSYSIPEAKRIVPKLEKADIEYEYEMDDSEIKNLSGSDLKYGTAGTGVKVCIYLRPENMEFAKSIL